jgi:mono/diheme cytochrome c family protein
MTIFGRSGVTLFILAWCVVANAESWTAKSPDLKNPYDGDPTAAAAGAKLYRRYCATCHGRDAEGIERIPALRSQTVKDASPGALFWVLKNGIQRRGMPSWSNLPEQQRWQIVTYLKTLEPR